MIELSYQELLRKFTEESNIKTIEELEQRKDELRCIIQQNRKMSDKEFLPIASELIAVQRTISSLK